MTGSDKDASGWKPLLDDLEKRRTSVLAMGGAEKLEKQRAGGRMDARQRIDELVDPGSFRELGTFVGGVARPGQSPVPADALVAGMAKIDGRPVLVGSEDFTSKGGSIGLGTHAKRMRLTILAGQEQVPLVMLLDGAGERTTNILGRYPNAPNDLQGLAAISGTVPTVAVVMGVSAGHGALTAMLMDFAIMTKGSAIFSAGPPIVAAATSEVVSKEDLGGPDIHVKESGVVHNLADTERQAIGLVRRYLSYFPSNARGYPPRSYSDDGRRRLDDILSLIPSDLNKPFDSRILIDMIADTGSVLEIQPFFGASIITALARFGGQPVAIVANQPAVKAGTIDSAAANKVSHFIEVADAFHLPLILLTDNPGIMAGSAAERSGLLRIAARMYMAQSKFTSPKVHVTLRKAYGFGSSIMGMNPYDRQTVSLAFPAASMGAMPAGGSGTAAHVDSETQAALNAVEIGGPWDPADTMNYDEIIDPRELRNYLLDAMELVSGREAGAASPKVGGIRP